MSALDPSRATLAIDSLTAAASERGATLVTTLHQVDVALQRFPRIVGLRAGHLAFDLPASAVTREHLAKLYAQFEHELSEHELSGAPVEDLVSQPIPTPQPAVMHCR